MSISQALPYPCNRGLSGNVSNRGWHRFETTQHGVACIYCGEKPAGKSLGERMRTAQGNSR